MYHKNLPWYNDTHFNLCFPLVICCFTWLMRTVLTSLTTVCNYSSLPFFFSSNDQIQTNHYIHKLGLLPPTIPLPMPLQVNCSSTVMVSPLNVNK